MIRRTPSMRPSEAQCSASKRPRLRNTSKNLPEHASGTSAQRRSNCNFFLAAERPRQCEVGHIHAGDEKNKSHRSQQNQQRRPHIADQIVMQGYDYGTPSFVVFRVLLLQPAEVVFILRLRLALDSMPGLRRAMTTE